MGPTANLKEDAAMDAITTFERRRIDAHKLYGRIIIASKDFTLMAMEDDFAANGFQIIRNRDITRKGIPVENRYWTALMKKEGTWTTKLPRGLRKLDLSSWSTIFTGIRAEVVIVENERAAAELFIIGPVVAVGSKAVTIHAFDAVGKWEDPQSVPYTKITSCKFLDRYSCTHAKYLNWGK
jgi:hypothetical protein